MSSAIQSQGHNKLEDILKATFKNEANRLNGTVFEKTHGPSQPDRHIAELLLQAGLFSLLGSSNALQAKQWIFYNGSLLSAPKEPLFASHYKNGCLSLNVPKLQGEPSLLYFIHITSHHEKSYNSTTQVSMTVEEKAETTIVECYLTLGEKAHFIQADTHIVLGAGAKVNHCIVGQRPQHQSGPQITQLTVRQQSYSEYQGFLTSFGLALSQAKILVELLGQQAHSDFNILMALKQTEYANIDLTMHHIEADCHSRILARAVLQDQSRFDFTGKMIVDPMAAGSNARLENKNLLLSPKAQANTEPQLEIYNGNIQCSHGATVGHLDENALFYLQSRGIPKIEAIQILVDAFLEPVMQNIPHPPFQSLLEKWIHGQH